MGAENSVLEGCSWEDELVCPQGFLWKITPIIKDDGTEGTVFEARYPEKKDAELLQMCAKTLLRLRHPNVIRFLGSGKSSRGFWMATEPVVPIVSKLQEMTSEELAAGVQDILQALDFMHSKLGVCHNNICPASVYVSKDGGWKLGGIEHACKFQEATTEFLDSRRVFRDETSLAPEEKAGHMKSDLSLGHARDVFAIGALVDAFMDLVKEKDGLLRELEQQITICVSADPSQRPTVSSLLNLPVFKSDFINIITFVKNVTVKTEKEKKEFFRHLLPKLQNLPEMVIARRLVVPLLSRFVLLNDVATEEVVPYILLPQKDSISSKESLYSRNLLSETLYKEYVIPHLCNIFRVHDCHIRMVLLKYFSSYVHLFSKEQLEEDIFLQVLLGVRDSDDGLVAASLKALSDLVPILGGDFVIGGTRKTFFFHGIPKQVTTEMEANLKATVNVSSVLSKASSTLLKDIALGAKNNTAASPVSAEERERKMMERQQRREEAKLKREERRRKLKEKQLQENEESTSQEQANHNEDKPIPTLTPTIEQIAWMAEGKKKIDDMLSSDGDGESRNAVRSEMDEQAKNNNAAVEKDATSDWSDWEDADGNISDEIEEELKRMSSSSSRNIVAEVTGVSSKVQTSPNPYRSPSPSPDVTVDWSDMPEADRTAASFSRTSASPPDVHPHSNSKEVDASWGESSLSSSSSSSAAFPSSRVSIDLGKPATSNQSSKASDTSKNVKAASLVSPRSGGLKLKSPSSSSSKSSSSTARLNSVKATTKLDDLGAGYDIKSIEIKTASPYVESDFFADMMPSISLPAKNSLDVLGSVKAATNTSASEVTSGNSKDGKKATREGRVEASKFAVDSSSIGQEDTSGWGADDDDLDWGNDNF